MNHFYQIIRIVTRDDIFIEKFKGEIGLGAKLNEGNSLLMNPPALSGKVAPRSGKHAPDLLPNGMFMMVSQKLKSILEEADTENLEFYPVEIKDPRTICQTYADAAPAGNTCFTGEGFV